MSSELWIGTLISVPIAIMSGLAVAPIQRWMDRWGQTSHQKKHSRMKVEYELVIDSALHPEMMIAGMIANLLYMSLYLFLMLLVLYLRPMFDILVDFGPRPTMNTTLLPRFLVLGSVFVIGLLCAITVFVIRLVINSAKLYLHVRLFSEYVKSIPDELRDLKMEKIIIYAARDRAVPGLNSLRSLDFNSPEGSNQDNVSPASQTQTTHTLPVPPALQK
jgi:hypothetical protein